MRRARGAVGVEVVSVTFAADAFTVAAFVERLSSPWERRLPI